MSKIAVVFLASAACLLAGPIINGDFETDTLAGWTTLGGAGAGAAAVGAQGNAVPAGGSFQALIFSGQSPLSPNDVAVATIETDLNLAAGAIATALPNSFAPTDGDAIYQTFSATAGQTLSFSWNFITTETVGSKYDGALYTLQLNSDSAQAFELADTTESGLVTQAVGASNPFNNGSMTGYSTQSINITTTGTYTLGFISMQTDDDKVSSGVYIDNVALRDASVPEPSSWLLVVSAAGLLMLRRRLVG